MSVEKKEQPALDIKKIRDYNNKLKAAKAEYSRIQSEITYANQELTRRCNELTEELGKDVTPENIEEIYLKEVDKINKDVTLGEEILNRIDHGVQEIKDNKNIQQEEEEEIEVPWSIKNNTRQSNQRQDEINLDTFEPFAQI